MSDRVLFPVMGAVALAMIALALVWPQGLGARSPAPFGHEPVQQVKAREAARRPKGPPPVLGMAPATPVQPAGGPR